MMPIHMPWRYFYTFLQHTKYKLKLRDSADLCFVQLILRILLFNFTLFMILKCVILNMELSALRSGFLYNSLKKSNYFTRITFVTHW